MTDNTSIFDDLMQALHEVEEHQKGNLKLKTRVVTEEELREIRESDALAKFSKLSTKKKLAAMDLINELYKEEVS